MKWTGQIILFLFENPYLHEFDHLRDTRWWLRLFNIITYIGWIAIVYISLACFASFSGDDLLVLPFFVVLFVGAYWASLQLLKTTFIYVIFGKKTMPQGNLCKYRKILWWFFGSLVIAILVGVALGYVEDKKREKFMEPKTRVEIPSSPSRQGYIPVSERTNTVKELPKL